MIEGQGLKLREVRVAIYENATAATLETDVNSFLAAGDEKELIGIQIDGDRIVVVYAT